MQNKNIINILETLSQEYFSLETVKNYLRVSDDYDNELISSLIDTAIIMAENFTNLVLLTRIIEHISHNSNGQMINLNYQPIQKILEIKIQDKNKEIILDNNVYQLNTAGIYFDPGLFFKKIIIKYISGIKPSLIPAPLKYGILLHIGELYERENSNESSISSLVKNLYLPYRKVRI